MVVDKGQDPNTQGYSAFQDSGLGDLLRERGIERLYVGGLATDYCVKNSVLDARSRGFDVIAIANAIRGVEVEPGDSDRAIEEMKDAGAVFATAAEVDHCELQAQHSESGQDGKRQPARPTVFASPVPVGCVKGLSEKCPASRPGSSPEPSGHPKMA